MEMGTLGWIWDMWGHWDGYGAIGMDVGHRDGYGDMGMDMGTLECI